MTKYGKSLLLVMIFSLNGCTLWTSEDQPVIPSSIPVASTSPKKPVAAYYIVRKGDSLSAIAKNHGIDYRQLAQWNRISLPYRIEIGQRLLVVDPATDHEGTELKEPHINSKSITLGSSTKSDVAGKLSTQNPAWAATENIKNIQEKRLDISIDNKNMLKLNFQWPVKGKVLKSFFQTNNKGIDIAGEVGQEVIAAETGKVVYSGQSLMGYGNLLIIKHQNDYLTAYANNSQLLITEGQWVKKGEVVAKVGRAGAHRASLHFEIRKNGKPIDPVVLLPNRSR